ncbi:hypothetical protein [Mycolicibacterium wolinskyi]|uniref:hypothetical protein n=1 Tax=Mycolicibacterium wolinskyi TaxID=59750 RepID=UPI003917808F
MKLIKPLRITIATTAILTMAFGTYVGVQAVTGGTTQKPPVDAVKVEGVYITEGKADWLPKPTPTPQATEQSKSEGQSSDQPVTPEVPAPTPAPVEQPNLYQSTVINEFDYSNNKPQTSIPTNTSANTNGIYYTEISTFQEPTKK